MNYKQLAVMQKTPVYDATPDEQAGARGEYTGTAGFNNYQGVPGWVAEDGKGMVMNPVSGYNPHIHVNEGMRQIARSGSPYLGNVPMTQEQVNQFAGPYGNNTEHGQHSVVARLGSNDPSAKTPTQGQRLAAERIFAEALLRPNDDRD